jgi:hypothetical protein
MTDTRERRLKRAMDAMNENTKAKAVDRTLAHYLADLGNKQRVVAELPTDPLEELSTAQLPIERTTVVGPTE